MSNTVACETLDAMCNACELTVLLWSVLAGSWATLRLSRLTRGRCPACNYDLRGNLAHARPECGWRRAENDAQQTGQCGGGGSGIDTVILREIGLCGSPVRTSPDARSDGATQSSR